MKQRRWLAVLVLFGMVLGLLPGTARATVVDSGTCGAGVTWTLDDAGTLMISGSGDMENYISNGAGVPWNTAKNRISTVTIEDGVTSIGANAFRDCSNLSSITIPDSVTLIGYSAFYGCSSLNSIAIPDSVTLIRNNAFEFCDGLTSIKIPNGITAIADDTFSSCSGLTSILIPDSVTWIGNRAFYDCNSLSNITLPNSVTALNQWTFYGCSSLSTITLPDGLTSINCAAFLRCNNLSSILVSENNKNFVSQNGILFNEDATTLLRCPEGLSRTDIDIPDSVTSIGDFAFGGCSNLTSITIPDSVTSVGNDAFYNCSGLTDVYYWGTEAEWNGITIGNSNDVLTAATTTIWYSGPATLDYTTPAAGEVDPVVTITSDRPFAPILARSFPATITTNAADLGLTQANASLTDNKTMQLAFTGTSNGGNLNIMLDTTAFAGPENFTASAVLNIELPAVPVNPDPTPDPDPEPTPEPEPTPDPVPTPPSRPSKPDKDKPKEPEKPVTVRVDDTIRSEEAEPVVISGVGESDMQHIVKDETYVGWIDRLDLPQYALDLYTVLCIGGDNDTLYDLLIKDEYHDLSGDAAGASAGSAEVESVLTLISEMDRPLANGGIFTEKHFTDSSFNVIDTTSGDRAVDYASLKEGDVVRTGTFNGIFATKVTKDGNTNYDAEVKAACDYVTTAFQAFDRDHPEVFWLSGKSKVRLITATIKNGNKTTKETYIFFTLADSDGFSVRDTSAPSQSEIEAQIARRDAAVEKILATVTGATPDEKARDLNRWLTENNEYNTTPDLTTIGNAPHECLSALEGRIGTDGPVCDGYSRAFKVLCGKLEIPCVLVDGFARYAPEHEGEFHMWNSVQMPDGNWYGVDVTWDDPVVPGVTGAKSGYENESFLLVGSETEIAGLKFSLSHPPVNRAANGGVSFINGPTLSAAAFVPMAGIPGMPFTDVAASSWYEEAVRYVYENRLMNGVTETAFAPGENMTRAMVWTILARLDGAELEERTPWYASSQAWAAEQGISDGTNPGGAITREQLAATLWRYMGSPESAGSLEHFADGGTVSGYAAEALSWAAEAGILTGLADGTIQPQGEATRAQVAVILSRFCGSIVQ